MTGLGTGQDIFFILTILELRQFSFVIKKIRFFLRFDKQKLYPGFCQPKIYTNFITLSFVYTILVSSFVEVESLVREKLPTPDQNKWKLSL